LVFSTSALTLSAAARPQGRFCAKRRQKQESRRDSEMHTHQ
jgi:hypothetical protein